jgi:predicted ATPase
MTSLVGREEEIALVLRRWRQACDGEGPVVLLSGEPGSASRGSCTRCANGFEGKPHIRLLCQCSPHHTTSPLHPVIEQLERAAGSGPRAVPADRGDRAALSRPVWPVDLSRDASGARCGA